MREEGVQGDERGEVDWVVGVYREGLLREGAEAEVDCLFTQVSVVVWEE